MAQERGRISKSLLVYLAAVHIALAVLVVRPGVAVRLHRMALGSPASSQPELTDFYRRMVASHERVDQTVPDGAVVFIGDSHIQGLCTDAVISPSVNFGIGGDTTAGVLARIPKYKCLDRAAAVVLAVGINDMPLRDNVAILENYREILRSIPEETPVVVCAVLPVDSGDFSNDRICKLNADLLSLCDGRCTFVDVRPQLVDGDGELAFHDGDGVHLNEDGYLIWIQAIRDALESRASKPR